MNRQLIKLPLYTLAAGILTRLLLNVFISLAMAFAGAWATPVEVVLFYVQCALSVLFFIIIGLRLRRIYTRSVCFRAASVLALYSLLSLALEQAMQYSGHYGLLNYYMYLPIEIFTPVTALLMRFSKGGAVSVLYAVPSLLAPYLFLLFTDKESRA